MRLRETLMVFAACACVPVAMSAQGGAQGGAPAARGAATAELKDAKGQTVARAELSEGANGVVVRLRFESAMAGERAFHVHQIGKCDPPAFDSAGTHFNPTKMTHGILSDKGPHAGDLPNVTVPTGGKGEVQMFVHGVQFGGANGLMDADGAALVMHAKPDDYRTDPSGSAGDRIACGVITKK